MNGPQGVGAGQPADWGAAAPGSDGVEQKPKATPRPVPGSAFARLMGQSPEGASQGASFNAPGGTRDVPYDQLDTLSQRMTEYGFSKEQINRLGNHAVLSKAAKVWVALKLHSSVRDAREFVVAVGSTEGADGLQRLYDMALAPNGAELLKEKAESMRRAKPDTH